MYSAPPLVRHSSIVHGMWQVFPPSLCALPPPTHALQELLFLEGNTRKVAEDGLTEVRHASMKPAGT